MARFHNLLITEVRREIEDAVSILFDVPTDIKDVFNFVQGQYITLKITIDGDEVRRSYSICSSPSDGELRVAVKKVFNGKFSTYANEVLKAGDHMEVMPPLGNFYTPLDASHEKDYVAFASGSGITPIISIIKTIMEKEPKSRFTLFYGNKFNATIIFSEELEGLKNTYLDRFSIYHVLSREVGVNEQFRGRLSGEKCRFYHERLIDFIKVDEVFLCGPEEMIFDVKDTLADIGVEKEKIHFELFTTAQDVKPKVAQEVSEEDKVASGDGSQVEVIIDGVSYEFNLSEYGDSVLDAAVEVGADVPFACKGGVCCACKCKVMEGSVTMDVNFALEQDELDEGFVLACQSHPTSDKLIIDFDEL